ncbi:hypothetical protein SAY86_009104 [Trapa natans]|uniref:Pectinesterase inhibitor domain-containing protein n=1 Tax=Trapa natans TaxID=22666 RepID=A0AAN7QBU2_TRANT|nr:hypothetical protein SAY86_009104 [Trapa natans]
MEPIRVLLISAIIMSISVGPSCALNQLGYSLCKKTSNYNLCVEALANSYVVGIPKIDVVTFAYSVFAEAKKSTADTVDYINSLIKGNAIPAPLKESLKTCLDDYGYASKMIVDVVDDMNKNRFDRVVESANDAGSRVGDCQKGLGGTSSPPTLSSKNQREIDLFQIASVIGKAITSYRGRKL